MNKEIVTGKVIKIIDEYTLVINKGFDDGINGYDKILVYFNDEELFDPDTNESLGFLEIVCGMGKVIHLQDKIATIASSKTIKTKKTSTNLFGVQTEELIDKGIEEFKNLEIGNLFRVVK